MNHYEEGLQGQRESYLCSAQEGVVDLLVKRVRAIHDTDGGKHQACREEDLAECQPD